MGPPRKMGWRLERPGEFLFPYIFKKLIVHIHTIKCINLKCLAWWIFSYVCTYVTTNQTENCSSIPKGHVLPRQYPLYLPLPTSHAMYGGPLFWLWPPKVNFNCFWLYKIGIIGYVVLHLASYIQSYVRFILVDECSSSFFLVEYIPLWFFIAFNLFMLLLIDTWVLSNFWTLWILVLRTFLCILFYWIYPLTFLECISRNLLSEIIIRNFTFSHFGTMVY